MTSRRLVWRQSSELLSPTDGLGWQLTGDPDHLSPPVRVFRHHCRIRVVMTELIDPWLSGRRRRRMLQQAEHMFACGADPRETIAKLVAISRSSRPLAARVSITVADLEPDGKVTLAAHAAPPVLRANPSDFAWIGPGEGERREHVHRLKPDERLVLTTGTFLGSLDPRFLDHLPALAADLRDADLLHTALTRGGRARDRAAPASGVLVITRIEPGLSPGEYPR